MRAESPGSTFPPANGRACTGRKEAELWQWLVKINPRELLLPQGRKIPPQYNELSAQVTSVPPGTYFNPSSSMGKITESQGNAGLKSLDLADKPELVRACGALLTYLEHTQKDELGHLGEFKPLNLGKHLLLDEVTEKNLEIFRRLDGKAGKGTLWRVLDRTMTPMGGRLLEARLRQPWRDLAPIEREPGLRGLPARAGPAPFRPAPRPGFGLRSRKGCPRESSWDGPRPRTSSPCA